MVGPILARCDQLSGGGVVADIDYGMICLECVEFVPWTWRKQYGSYFCNVCGSKRVLRACDYRTIAKNIIVARRLVAERLMQP